MKYEEFVNQMVEALNGPFAELVNHAEVSTTNVDKLQGQSYYGISIHPTDSNIGVSMDLTEVFNKHELGADFSMLVLETGTAAMNAVAQSPQISVEELTDFSQMRMKLMVQMVPTEKNAELLSNVPHVNVQDMSMVYRIAIEQRENNTMTCLVNNDMLRQFGITAEELHTAAMEEVPENYPASIRSMKEVLSEMLGIDMMPDSQDEPSGLYVASCNDGLNGAGVICYPDFMQEAAEKLGGDFFVLPSSVHEVLLLPDDGNQDYHDLEDMVRGINATEVAPEDRLSDNVFHYDSKAQVFEKASDHADRLQAEQRSEKVSVLDRLADKQKEVPERSPKPLSHKREEPAL